MRLLRSCFNFSVLFLGAPLIASIYGQPVLVHALRLFSLQFLISGLESMSFVLSQRDQRARISNYADMISNAAMAIFVIAIATVLKSYVALIYGVLLQRTLLTLGSYLFYRKIGVGIAFDREAIAEQFRFARFVMPSSLLTIVLSQYDKLALLRFFDLALVGVYSISGNMIGPISGVIMHNARVILYARCAAYFRSDPATAAAHYYQDQSTLTHAGRRVTGYRRRVLASLRCDSLRHPIRHGWPHPDDHGFGHNDRRLSTMRPRTCWSLRAHARC